MSPRGKHAGTDGNVYVPDVPPPYGPGVRTLPHAGPFKRKFGTFDAARVTFSNNEGEVIPMMLPRNHNYASRFHRVGLRITYAPPPGGWNEEEAPDSGGTSRESITPPRRRRRSRSRSARRIEYDGAGKPQHRAGGRTVSVSP